MTSVNQGVLNDVLRKIFSGKTILENARSFAPIINPSTRNPLELDAYIPDLNISFEFQDTHHYTTAWYSQFPLEDINTQDNIKNEIAHKNRITLIQVPCWWDGSASELYTSIVFHRPDLYNLEFSTSTPISLNPPLHYFFPGLIPDVGELMLASAPPFINISNENWWMGEKYDGIRIGWNSFRNSLYTRTGVKLFIPEILTRHFPPVFLDGEIWYGRGCFPESQKFMYSLTNAIDWASFRMVCFDTMGPDVLSLPFEKRYGIILQHISSSNPVISLVTRIWCSTNKHMTQSLKFILSDEGEGIMLRKPNSLYEHGRSSSVLKLKGTRGDQEALVLNVDDHTIQLQLPDGVVFETQEDVLELHRGDVVTFSYVNYTRSFEPFRPKITRVRYDYAWDEILNDYHRKMPPDSHMMPHGSKHEIELDEPTSMRDVLEEFASTSGFDPLVPSNWYKRSDLEFENENMSQVKRVYGDFRQALLQLFPEIGLDMDEFISFSYGNWEIPSHRRKYFELMATHYEFSPLVPAEWYTITPSQLRSVPNSYEVCSYHDGDFAQALIDLFPELTFIKSKFIFFNTQDLETRAFMENFAWIQGFDFMNPEHWYSKGVKFRRAKQSKIILNQFNGSFVDAVMRTFPNIGLVRSQFNDELWATPANQYYFLCNFAKSVGYDPQIASTWYSIKLIEAILQHEKAALFAIDHDTLFTSLRSLFSHLSLDNKKMISKDHFLKWENRKAFFEEFASENDFNPTIPKNWYSHSRSEFLLKQNASYVLQHYHGSYANALLDLFPTIGIKKGKILITVNDFWAEPSNRRHFFNEFAKSRAFDPLIPENWYNIAIKDIRDLKNGKSVLLYGGGSLKKVLIDTYPSISFPQQQLT